ncbi:hypothetical protein JCM3774_004785 [Rhodotorula dairenensis]
MRLSRCFPPASRPPDPLAWSGWRTQVQHRPPPQPAPHQARAPNVPAVAIAQARAPAAARGVEEQRHQQRTDPVASTSKPVATPASRACQELNQLVESFPTSRSRTRTAHRSKAEVQSDVATWRRACAAAHAALSSLAHHRRTYNSTPAQTLKGKGKAADVEKEEGAIPPALERKVVRLVAETMRLLLHLGHVRAAADLDRAFFTTRKRSRSEQKRRHPGCPPSSSSSKSTDGEGNGKKPLLGDGLGLQRGRDHLAWMQAVNLHLHQGEGSRRPDQRDAAEGQQRRALRGVEAALAGARVHAGGPGPLDSRRQDRLDYPTMKLSRPPSDLLAFAARHMGTVQRLVRTGSAMTTSSASASPPPGARLRQRAESELGEEIRAWLGEVRKAECERGDEVVSMALLESGLDRLEKAMERRNRSAGGRGGGGGGGGNRAIGDGPLREKVEGDIEQLVQSLETPSSHAAAAVVVVTPKQVRRHAHILALAIRFLLFRHRLGVPPVRGGQVDPLLSASQLYAVLLKVPLPAPLGADLLAEVRARQTSSLFRLLDAHLALVPHQYQHDVQQQQQYPGGDHRRTLDRSLDLLDRTVDRLQLYHYEVVAGDGSAMREEDLRLLNGSLRVGVSAQTYQRLLRLLAEPYRPRSAPRSPSVSSRHHHQHGPVPPTQQTPSGQSSAQPSFTALSRALEVIARCRTHDQHLSLLPASSPRRPANGCGCGGGGGGGGGSAVFSHPKTTIHFARAWFAAATPALAAAPPPVPYTSPVPPPSSSLLDGSSPSSSLTRPGSGSGAGSEIAYRLESLLTFVDAIDPASVSSSASSSLMPQLPLPPTPLARLRSRKVVAKAVREIVDQRWGGGSRSLSFGTTAAVVAESQVERRPTPRRETSGCLADEKEEEQRRDSAVPVRAAGAAAPTPTMPRDWRDLVVETRLTKWLLAGAASSSFSDGSEGGDCAGDEA